MGARPETVYQERKKARKFSLAAGVLWLSPQTARGVRLEGVAHLRSYGK